MVAHIAQALHNDPFAIKRAGKTRRFDIRSLTEEFPQGVLYPAPRRLNTSCNPACMGRLAGDTSGGVDVRGVHAAVLVRDPRHFTLPRTHVGGGHVLTGMDQIAFGKFIGKTAGYPLKLIFFPIARVNAQPPLGAAKGCFNQSTFISHERGQRLNLVLIDAHGIADAALHGFHMLGMDGPVAGKRLNLAAQTDTKAHRVSRVANPDLFLKPRGQIHQSNSPVEHDVYAFAE